MKSLINTLKKLFSSCKGWITEDTKSCHKDVPYNKLKAGPPPVPLHRKCSCEHTNFIYRDPKGYDVFQCPICKTEYFKIFER